MRPPGAVLELSPGCAVVLDGRQWTVEWRIPHLGQVLLTDPAGKRQQVTFQFLLTHPRCFTSSRTAASGANRGRQEATAADLHPDKRKLAELRMTHVLEMRTGFRSGSPLRPGPGEPKPEYNPDTTTLTQRRHAKLAELTAIDPEQARLTALYQVSFRTLVRWDLGEQNAGIVGCADHRWLRESGGRPSITENVREAVLSVRQETLHRARLSMRDKHLLICQHMRDTYGSDDEVPSYRTLGLRPYLREHGPNDLTAALEALADRLDATPGLIDYRRRRQALRGWCLDPDTWQEIISRLPAYTCGKPPDVDDRKRQEASAYIWTRVTKGEARNAPHPIAAAQPEDVRKAWVKQRSVTWARLTRPGSSQHYTGLRNLLIEHADRLARDIDSGSMR